MFPAEQRRPMRLEFWGDEIESIRRFVPSTQLSAGAVDVAEIGPARELILDDALRARARDAAAELDDERVADLLGRIAEGLAPDGLESAASFLFDDLPAPAAAFPDGAWVVLTEARRTRSRARAAHDDAEALAEAAAVARPARRAPARGRARRVGPSCTCRLSRRATTSQLRSWGAAAASPTELTEQLRGPARAGLPARGHGARARLARAGARGARRSRGGAGGVGAHIGFRVRSGQDRGAHRGGPLRGEAVHARGPPVHRAAQRRRGRRADPRGFRGPPDPRGGPLHGDRAPGARRLRTRLSRAGVREGRQALRALRRGGHGGPLHRRGRAAGAPHGRHGLGAGDGQGQARRPRHGGRAGASLHRADVRAGLRVRPRHALAARAGGRVPLRGDARSAAGDRGRQARHGAARPDGPAALRRRRVRQDGGRGARRVQGGHERQAGRGARADDAARGAAPPDVPRTVRAVPGDGADALAVRRRRRAGRRDRRHRRRARSTS